MTYSPLQVANTFIDLASSDNHGLSTMKLLKLVYLAHGWNLAINDEPLINEPVEAWQYGPVISSIYHEFKSYGNTPISGKGMDWTGGDQVVNNQDISYQLIKRVWDVYKSFSGIQLSNKTHEPNTPWSNTWSREVPRGTDIPNELIKSHFKELAIRQ